MRTIGARRHYNIACPLALFASIHTAQQHFPPPDLHGGLSYLQLLLATAIAIGTRPKLCLTLPVCAQAHDWRGVHPSLSIVTSAVFLVVRCPHSHHYYHSKRQYVLFRLLLIVLHSSCIIYPMSNFLMLTHLGAASVSLMDRYRGLISEITF